jgi:isopenicillin N synthase-like dioxygenase
MKLDIISYHDLFSPENINIALGRCEAALQTKGILGVKDVPNFEQVTRAYIDAARKFSALPENIKRQYEPNRDAGETEGYELGAEKFQDEHGIWQIDDKKASFYARVPHDSRNRWPQEIDLKTPYLALGELMFHTAKLLLKALRLDESPGLNHEKLTGYGRMLHYHKEGDATNANANWCGAHLDHGALTALIPAYYYRDGKEIEEPAEAGLYIVPAYGSEYEKIDANDKSILLFQIGEFAQLASNDRMRATRHVVRKSIDGVERYTLALFCDTDEGFVIQSHSELTKDERYANHKSPDGSISYGAWANASYERYRAR